MERLLGDAHALARDWWDPGRRLLAPPGDGDPLAATTWWALGLLRRGQPGDREVAEVAVRGVVDALSDSGSRRAAPRDATWAGLALLHHDHDLPTTLATDLRALVTAGVSAAEDVAVTATSTAVLRAWLELEVGRWGGDEDRMAAGAARARGVAADAGVRGHVAEHNSPTATGMTLLGLSLWAERPPVDDLAPLGRALRDEVWHDLLAVWHPGLRTLVPPFSRATGVDLRSHVAATGLWLAWLVDGVDPLPPLHDPGLRGGDLLPLVFLVDALAEAGQDVLALAPLVRAQPARQGEWFDRVGERVWTGWTGGDLVVGAEWSPVDRGDAVEVVTAAAVWRGDGGRNAWLRLHQQAGAVEARVEIEDGVVRLAHGADGGAVQLWTGGGGRAAVASDRVVLGGRTWRCHGIRDVARVDCAVPHVEHAWELTAAGDGIALTTEA